MRKTALPIAFAAAALSCAFVACDGGSDSPATSSCGNYDGGTLERGVAAGGIDTGPPDAVTPDAGASDDGGAADAAEGGAPTTADAGAPNVPVGRWVWQSSNSISCTDEGLSVTVSGTGALGSLFGFIRVAPDGKTTFGTAGLPMGTMTVEGPGGVLQGESPAWTGLVVDGLLTSADGAVVMRAKGELAVACP